MPNPAAITKVPDAQVPAVKAAYEHLGATVTVTPLGGGFSLVQAVWPNSALSTATTHASSAFTVAADHNVTSHVIML